MRRPLACLLLAALAACGATSAPSAARHELHLVLPLDPASMSPLHAFAQDEIALVLLWCQTLVGLDASNRLVPVLAERVPTRANGDISPDGRQITYHLRRDVQFADGVALTSADVAFTYRALRDPANATASLTAYDRIASLTTPDPYTVVVRLHRRWNAAVRELFAEADFAYGILPAHVFRGTRVMGSAWESHAFGTGPFRVVTWRRGDVIELAPNPYFHPAPKLARLVFRIIPDRTAAYNALVSGGADAVQLDPDHAVIATRVAGIRVTRTPVNGVASLYLQTRATPTDEPAVRHAVVDALDLSAISTAWNRVYPVARSIFPPQVVFWRQPARPVSHRDLRTAARLLDDAGWSLDVDVAFERQATTAVPAQRAAAFAAIDARVRSDVPIVPLYYDVLVQGVRDRVRAYRRNMLQYPVRAESWDVAP